jgi:Rad3-related DNA helicase
MDFSLDQRTCRLSAGEFSGFTLGPRDGGSGGPQGVWRAQLGTHWHQQLRAQTLSTDATAEFEVTIDGQIFHRGWTISFNGRIDQLLRTEAITTLREIKTVTQPLPVDETELRADYPDYFIQIATYAALWRLRRPNPSADREIAPPDRTSRLPTLAPAPVVTPIPPPRPSPSSLPISPPSPPGLPPPSCLGTLRAELVFVEAGSGLAQTVPVTFADDGLFRAQLDRLVEFLDLRLRARERLRKLSFRPAFAQPRPGQATTRAELTAAFAQRPAIFFEAPTGFGKTGVLLEFALDQLRSGHFDRALYLTSKSTGQLQVVRQLAAMTAPAASHPLDDKRLGTAAPSLTPYTSPLAPAVTSVAAWHVRNKAEHCVNTVFNCTRDTCSYLNGAEARWPQSGLSRFYLFENQARDLETLRIAGRNARICPYEITRAALAFNDVWIGDYNYVFSPSTRGLFYEQPGFEAARTLVLVDEAHNLPSRVADVYSHAFAALAAAAVASELHRIRPHERFMTLWDQWAHFLHTLRPCDALPLSEEDDARQLLKEIATQLSHTPLDYAALAPGIAETLWEIPSLVTQLEAIALPRLWWSPRAGELALTCLDAAAAIGGTLREFGGAVLASATFGPTDFFSAACGLDSPPRDEPIKTPAALVPERLGVLNKRATKKLYTQLTSAAALLKVEEANDAASPFLLRAETPWRDGAYDVAIDARVDTTFQQRTQYYEATALTIEALHASDVGPDLASAPASRVAPGTDARSVPTRCIAVFFSSYAYAEVIQRTLAERGSALRVALQPKLSDLAAQSLWVDSSLAQADVLFLVLGSSFAESIDVLGGRVTRAMVVGPALPEVNAVQRARLATFAESSRAGASAAGRETAFRRVYQIPGMTKVNQALGRLVRAPGQRAKVLLHCRRFAEASYRDLLAAEYRDGTVLRSDDDFASWLGR